MSAILLPEESYNRLDNIAIEMEALSSLACGNAMGEYQHHVPLRRETVAVLFDSLRERLQAELAQHTYVVNMTPEEAAQRLAAL